MKRTPKTESFRPAAWTVATLLAGLLVATGCSSTRSNATASPGEADLRTAASPEGDVTPKMTTGEAPRATAGETGAADSNAVSILLDAFFGFDEYALTEDSRASLARSAEWLSKNHDVRVVLEGHCDERGTREYNLSLGEKRASAAADYLVALGVDRSRIRIVSFGKERPFDPGQGEAAWARNRRAHFALASK